MEGVLINLNSFVYLFIVTLIKGLSLFYQKHRIFMDGNI